MPGHGRLVLCRPDLLDVEPFTRAGLALLEADESSGADVVLSGDRVVAPG